MDLLRLTVIVYIVMDWTLSDAFARSGGNCPRPRLSNGRAKIRMRGRMVFFRCRRQFQLYGSRMSACINGNWSKPTPVCIAPGCPDIDAGSNVIITSSYKGALLTFVCGAGNKINGPTEIYCNRKTWNLNPPDCIPPVTMTSCGFERDELCGWTQDRTDEFDWTKTSGTTPSGYTGPAYDHTYGRSGDTVGHFMYTEASAPRVNGDSARLISPVYTSHTSGQCFQLWYHMFGPDGENMVGKLEVFLRSPEDTETAWFLSFSVSGNQGNQWHPGHFVIANLTHSFQIVISTTRGTSYNSDIAIDDVSILDCVNVSTEDDGTTISHSAVNMTATKSATSARTSMETQMPTGTQSTEVTQSVRTITTAPATPSLAIDATTRQHKSTDIVALSTRATSLVATTTSSPYTVPPSPRTASDTVPPSPKTASDTVPPSPRTVSYTVPPSPSSVATSSLATRPSTLTSSTAINIPTTNTSPQTKPSTAHVMSSHNHASKTSKDPVDITLLSSTTLTRMITNSSSVIPSLVTNNININTDTSKTSNILENSTRRPRKVVVSQASGTNDWLPLAVGIGAGVLVGLTAVSILVWVWSRKQKRRNEIEAMEDLRPITTALSNNSLNLNLITTSSNDSMHQF